jgi:hypothetical protein
MHRRKVAVLVLLLSTGLVGFAGTASASANTRTCATDGGDRVQVCIYQDTSNDLASRDYEYIDVTQYRFFVKRIDKTSTTLGGGKLTMRGTVWGPCHSGCSGYSSGKTHATTVALTTSANVGKVFTLRVPWHNSTIKVDSSGDNAAQAGDATIRFRFRGNAVKWEVPAVCAGSTSLGFCD